MKRWFAITLMLLLAVTFAWGNPLPDPRVGALSRLIGTMAERSTPADEERMARLVGDIGLEFIAPDSLGILDARFERFERALVWSQRPGYGLDPSVQAVLRARLSGSLRDTVMAQLRGWLRETSSHEIALDAREERLKAQRLLERQVTAAFELGEWRDPAGADAIRDRIDRGVSSEWNLAELRRALELASDPCAGRILASDGRGNLHPCIGAFPLTGNITYFHPRSGRRVSQRRFLRPEEVDALLRAIDGAREGILVPSQSAEAYVDLTAPGVEPEQIQWLGGSLFYRRLRHGDRSYAFSNEAAPALLEPWTSGPVTERGR